MSDCVTSFDTDRRMLRSCRRAAKHFEHVWLSSGQRQWKYRDRARIWQATRDQSQQPTDLKVADFVDGLEQCPPVDRSRRSGCRQRISVDTVQSWLVSTRNFQMTIRFLPRLICKQLKKVANPRVELTHFLPSTRWEMSSSLRAAE